MNSGQHNILRAFCGEHEVVTTTVAVVPSASSCPNVGQVIEGTWKVTEILESPQGEYRIRVLRLEGGCNVR